MAWKYVETPAAFEKFGLNLDPYLLEDINGDVVGFALSQLDEHETRIVRDHLELLLTKPFDADNLQRAWRASGANFNFRRDGDLRIMVRAIADRIDASARASG